MTAEPERRSPAHDATASDAPTAPGARDAGGPDSAGDRAPGDAAVADAPACPAATPGGAAAPGAKDAVSSHLDVGSGDRPVAARYDDPLELLWLAAAADLGLRVERSDEVYAAWDGRGTLTLSAAAGFDADDCLAQLLFHELCHALVEGPAAQRRADWGLSNRDLGDLPRELACHRLQAALAGAHGLRDVLAPTTEHRGHYDALPDDPLALPDDADAVLRAEVEAARAGWERATDGPWADVLRRVLADTAALARLVAPHAPADSLWRRVAPAPDAVPPGVARAPGREGGDAVSTSSSPREVDEPSSTGEP